MVSPPSVFVSRVVLLMLLGLMAFYFKCSKLRQWPWTLKMTNQFAFLLLFLQVRHDLGLNIIEACGKVVCNYRVQTLKMMLLAIHKPRGQLFGYFRPFHPSWTLLIHLCCKLVICLINVVLIFSIYSKFLNPVFYL